MPLTTSTVRCKWVPGSDHLVGLRRLETGEAAVIELHHFNRLVGREGVDALYLYGLFDLECRDVDWQHLRAPTLAVEG